MIEPQERTSFATRLARLREARQLSQKQLAARAGCPPAVISRYERGLQLPRSPEAYLQLCAALSVSIAELLGAPLAPGARDDLRLDARVQALKERLPPAWAAALLALLDAALVLTDGDPLEAVAPGLGGAV
jgi:transcriptional regulator with XRE-family HTH domain